LNLYLSEIPTYIIAFQLDMNEDDVSKIIQSISNNSKPLLASPLSVSLSENKFDKDRVAPSLNKTVNMDIAISNAQTRMWKALRAQPKLSIILQTFMQEIASLIISYGGYVLK
jgi:hypothetical protein